MGVYTLCGNCFLFCSTRGRILSVVGACDVVCCFVGHEASIPYLLCIASLLLGRKFVEVGFYCTCVVEDIQQRTVIHVSILIFGSLMFVKNECYMVLYLNNLVTCIWLSINMFIMHEMRDFLSRGRLST